MSSRRIFIAEKPSAARAIADGIGNVQRKDGYFECANNTAVSYCVGHLFQLEEPDFYLPESVPTGKGGRKRWRSEDLPIIPETWVTKPKPETKAQLNILGKLIKDADEIVHAGDVDREGQSIIDSVISHFKFNGSVKRFSVSAQDETSIKRGLENLQDNRDFEGWRLASEARQRADWLVGMNLSRALTLATQARGDNSLLVVGRVQSPTLALVVRRDEAIRDFKPIDYFQVNAIAAHEAGEFKTRWSVPESADYVDEDGRVTDKNVADSVCSALTEAGSGVVSKYELTPKSTPQPLGLSLSDITLAGSNRFGMTAEQVLKTVQSLYEKKLCSYPRSDCSYLPLSQLADAADVLAAVAVTHDGLNKIISSDVDLDIKSRIWNDKKVTAHHAIVPTQKKGAFDELDKAEQQLYDLIARNYVSQFCKKHQFDSTVLELTVEQGGNSYLLSTTGNTVTEMGWKAVLKTEDDSDDKEVENLPVVAVNDTVVIGSVEVNSKKTTPPKHFTEGTLIKALENIFKYVTDDADRASLREGDGLGTPATRSSIISELKRRGYLEPKGKKYLVSTAAGERLVGTLPEVVCSAVYTAQYERELKAIQNNEGSMEEFVNSQIQYVTEQVAKADESIAKAPPPAAVESEHNCTCGGGLVRRKGKEKGFWWSCSTYPACKNTYPDKRGKPDLKAVKSKTEAVETDYTCPKCEKPLIRRKAAKGNNKWWFGCSGFPGCKERFFDKDGAPDIKAEAI